MWKNFTIILAIIFIFISAPLFAATVSTVNFTTQTSTLNEAAGMIVTISVTDAGAAAITNNPVTLSVLSGTLGAVQQVATTDGGGLATFSVTAGGVPATTVLEAYCLGVTSNTIMTIYTIVAIPVFNSLSTPTRSITQVISGTKAPEAITINITCNSGILEGPVVYTGTTWTATYNSLAEGINIITINAIDIGGYSSTYVTAPIVVDITSPSITLTFPAGNGFDNSSLKIEYSLSEKCITGSIVMTFTETGTALDINSPHTVTASLTNLSGLNSFFITGNDLNNDGSIVTSDTLVDGAVYFVSINALDLVGNTSVPTGSVGFTYDISPPSSAASLVAVAHPGSRVALSWAASPSSDVCRYEVYRGLQSNVVTSNIGVGTTTNLTFDDMAPVSSANNYYQVLAVDFAGNVSVSSNQITAGNIAIAKTAAVTTSGNPSSTIPGATITYTLTFINNGYGTVSGISVVDLVPTTNVTFKVGSATANVTCSINYQNWPFLTFDGNDLSVVTAIKWNTFPVMNAGEARVLSYAVIIQ